MRLAALIVFLVPTLLFGQHDWTLKKCIDSAIVNNSNMKLSEVNLSKAARNAASSKWNFLPNLTGNASHGYNWGQAIDPFTNSFATDQVRFNNFYLSSNATVFSGLKNYYESKIAGIDQEIELAKKDMEQRKLTLEIIDAYLQAKLNEEIVLLNAKHASFSKEQVERAVLLEEVEYETQLKRLESEAEATKDQYELVLSNNNLKQSLLQLQLLIGINPDSTFSLSDSVAFLPMFESNPLHINGLEAQKNLMESKRLKGNLSPTISLNASIGSGYSENNKFIDPNGTLTPKPFNDQLNENFYQSVSINLTIPIFSGVASYSRIAINKLELERITIENEQRSVEMTNQSLQNKLEVENQKNALKFAQKSFESYKRLFEDSALQYQSGAIDYYQHVQNKDAFFEAESALIQAEYRLKFMLIVSSILELSVE